MSLNFVNTSRLNLFLKNLKNGKNIPSDKILNYSKMLGYSANTLNSLHKEVSTNKNLKRNNQTQIKNALGGLIAQKLKNTKIQEKRNQIKEKIKKNNLSGFLNAVGNAGYQVGVVPRSKIIEYLKNQKYNKLKKELETLREHFSSQNKNIEKSIQNRIDEIIKTIPPQTKAPSNNGKNPINSPNTVQTTQAPPPPPTSPKPVQTQTNSKQTTPRPIQIQTTQNKRLILSIKRSGPRSFSIVTPHGTANKLNLVGTSNGGLKFVIR